MRSLLCVLIAAGIAASTAQAQSNFSFEGTFLTDDQVQLFNFTLASSETVSFQTWGYGGGTNAADALISPGGFESLLEWFGSDGSFLYNSSSCGAGQTYNDACLDVAGSMSLGAGTYTLALTQAGNDANSQGGFPGDLGYGFSEQGLGDYTTAYEVPDCTAFCSVINNDAENGNWAVDILNVSSASEASPTPEPATMLLGGCSLALLGLARRRQVGRNTGIGDICE